MLFLLCLFSFLTVNIKKINFGIIFVNIVTVKSWNRAAEFGRRTKLGQNNHKLLEVVIQKQLKTSFG